jgi:hypothetical protein
MQNYLREWTRSEGVGHFIPLQKRLKVVQPDVTDQRPGGLHHAAGEALISAGKEDSLSSLRVRLSAAIASTEAENISGLIIDKCPLPWVQVVADALQEVGGLFLRGRLSEGEERLRFGQAREDGNHQMSKRKSLA